jgi:PAS domain S-box-containing protein
LAHLAEGLTDKEIGFLLGSSRFTINKHVTGIMTKMDAQSRTEAAVRAVRERLLVVPVEIPASEQEELENGQGGWRPLGFTHDPVLVADENGRYIDANRAAESLLGIARDDLQQLHVSEVVMASTAWSRVEYSRFLADGYWVGQIQLKRSDGSPLAVEARAMTLSSPNGTVGLSVLREITQAPTLALVPQRSIEAIKADLTHPLAVLSAMASVMPQAGGSQARSHLAVEVLEATRALERVMSELTSSPEGENR